MNREDALRLVDEAWRMAPDVETARIRLTNAILAAVAERDKAWRAWWEQAKSHQAICPKTYEQYHATPDRVFAPDRQPEDHE